jgi:hypothetical protein
MPLRHHVAAIVLFWVGMTGWMLYRDVWPWLGPGEPPPFSIDLADEVQAVDTRWKVIKDDKEKGYAHTNVRYNGRDDTYELNGEFKLWSAGRSGIHAASLADQVINSMYRVNRQGELRGMEASVKVTVLKTEVEVVVKGRVEERKFLSHIEVKGLNYREDLPPVDVSTRGSVLNPLQPLNRLPGLRKGQRWRMPLVDPLADALAAHPLAKTFQGKTPDLRSLDARVLPQVQMLEWGHKGAEVPCLVVEYSGGDVSARTWVRETDGLVLQQEVSQNGDELKLVRD